MDPDSFLTLADAVLTKGGHAGSLVIAVLLYMVWRDNRKALHYLRQSAADISGLRIEATREFIEVKKAQESHDDHLRTGFSTLTASVAAISALVSAMARFARNGN